MNSPFPASYSTLSPTALSALIAEKYAISNVTCRFLVRGVGDTYLVESPDSRFILRVYRGTHRSLPQIKEEVELLTALRQADIPVSYPLPDVSGEYIQTLDAVEGIRHAVLFTYAPGQSLRLLSENQLRILGHQMARFHKVSSTLRLGSSRWTFDIEATLTRPLEMLRPVFSHDPEGYAWLQQAAGRAAKKLGQPDASTFAKGYCHFDFLPKNFHFEGDSITFFDFDFMGYGWLVNDLMTFWQHLILDVYAGRMKQHEANDAYGIFLNAYREVRPLREEELEAVPYLSLGFWLFYMGFHTTHDQFSVFSQPFQLKLFLGFLRHLVEKHWDA